VPSIFGVRRETAIVSAYGGEDDCSFASGAGESRDPKQDLRDERRHARRKVLAVTDAAH
jgi:hypothetical protein